MRVVFDHGQICRDHRIQQGNEQTNIFEPTNESAVWWSTTHLEVGVSSVVVMMPMHGENLLKKQTTHNFLLQFRK